MDKALDDIIKENNQGLGKFMRRNRGGPQRRNNNREGQNRGRERNQRNNNRGGNFSRQPRERFDDDRRHNNRNPNYGMMIDRELTVPRSYRRTNDEQRNNRNGGQRPLRNSRRNYGFNHDPSKVGP